MISVNYSPAGITLTSSVDLSHWLEYPLLLFNSNFIVYRFAIDGRSGLRNCRSSSVL
jgi:hypothetical protein